MLAQIWDFVLVNPILNTLVYFNNLTGSLGLAIILLTIFIRTILIPVTIPSLKSMKKQRDIQPELDKLKKKYGYDKQKHAQMQMELLKQHGINPASGCLTQIVMIMVLIALYGVISRFTSNINLEEINRHLYFDWLKLPSVENIKMTFLYLNMGKNDPYYIMAVLSGALQFIQSKMMFPYVETAEKAAEKTPDKSDDMAYNLQSQMMYTMPIMNFVIGLTLPSGVVLYILTTTVFSIVQTYFISGLGGLTPWAKKLKIERYFK